MLRNHVEATHERLTKLERAVAASGGASNPISKAVRKPLEQADEKATRVLVAALEATRGGLKTETD
jgi:hypothetical protein